MFGLEPGYWPGTGFLAWTRIFGLDHDRLPETRFVALNVIFGLEPVFWPGTDFWPGIWFFFYLELIFGLKPDVWPGRLIFDAEPDVLDPNWPGTGSLAWNLILGLEPDFWPETGFLA